MESAVNLDDQDFSFSDANAFGVPSISSFVDPASGGLSARTYFDEDSYSLSKFKLAQNNDQRSKYLPQQQLNQQSDAKEVKSRFPNPVTKGLKSTDVLLLQEAGTPKSILKWTTGDRNLHDTKHL